jgi:hypothetical protein
MANLPDKTERPIYRLIGNPHPVFDGNWQESCGFDSNDVPDFVLHDDCLRDVRRIILAVERSGYLIEPAHAYYAWEQHSVSLEAHWLLVPDNDEQIFNAIRRFLLVAGAAPIKD